MDESGTDGAECSRKVASGKRVTDAIRSLVNTRGLRLESLLVPVLTYGSETMIWKEKSRAVHMDNLRGFIGNRRMDKGVVRSKEGSR